MAVKRKAKQLAHEAAIAGDIGSAVPQLEALLAAGDAGAAASLAEIEAFQGHWSDVLRHAYTYLRMPSSVYAQGNFFDDMTNLVALAGLKNADWAEIQTEMTTIRAHLQATGELTPYSEGFNKFATDIDQLLGMARSEGKAAYVWDWASTHNAPNEDARAAKFAAGLAELSARKKKPWKNDVERRRHLFSLAMTYGSQLSATRLYDEEGMDDLIHYGSMVFVASSLARAGRADDAWRVVEKTLPRWWPVDLAQVAPVVLLTDEGLRPLMTPERCAWVLRTPRGAAAVPPKPKKKK